ncbi:GNAT family N-acetyltransferase [Roseibium sp. TrichSKD4]|uniref:GNAT family N-acetyltransferase n=1 Tax=Roseibium sp. TrichSKD4 TaxID=744980 RepID=UPI000A079E3E|nr:GNAT family N-acetyltransferase [Roseibium sp. TrichSKD4]
MSIGATVRTVKLCDVEEIAKIHVACWKEVYSFMPDAVHLARSLRYRRNQWLNWVIDPPEYGFFFVILFNGEIAGFAAALRNMDEAIIAKGEMHACYILPEYRGTDAGPLGLMTLASTLKSSGLWPACLWAFKDNPYRRIYPQLGCKAVVSRDRVIAEAPIPEVGYIVPDYDKLMSRLDRMRVSAVQRRNGSLQRPRLLAGLPG